MNRIEFDPTSGRCRIGERQLHCGDCFQLNADGHWIDVRIEHNSAGWYLVTGFGLLTRFCPGEARDYQ